MGFILDEGARAERRSKITSIIAIVAVTNICRALATACVNWHCPHFTHEDTEA